MKTTDSHWAVEALYSFGRALWQVVAYCGRYLYYFLRSYILDETHVRVVSSDRDPVTVRVEQPEQNRSVVQPEQSLLVEQQSSRRYGEGYAAGYAEGYAAGRRAMEGEQVGPQQRSESEM